MIGDTVDAVSGNFDGIRDEVGSKVEGALVSKNVATGW